jgi:hypothetical protein
MKRSRFLIGFLATLLILLLSVGISPTAMADSTKTIVGEQKQLGNGSVRTWLQVDENNQPLRLGVTLTESALSGLPGESDEPQEGSLKLHLMDGSPNHTFEYELKFPKEAEQTAFTHMGFNWNPIGHGPENVFDKPHFDVHFYTATPEYRHNIKSEDSQDVEISNRLPARQYIPAYFALAPNTAEPRMGSHYADIRSPQLNPGNFSNIFLFGVHNAFVVFWEPMITKEYLETKPNFSGELAQPESYPVSGYYPTSYSVVYNKDRKEVDISLDGLKLRTLSYAGNIYGINSCLDSRLAQIIATSGKIPADASVQKCLNIVEEALKKSQQLEANGTKVDPSV